MNAPEPSPEHLLALALLYEQEGLRLLTSSVRGDDIEYQVQAELNFMQAYTMSSKVIDGAAAGKLKRELEAAELASALSVEALISFRICAAAVLGHMRSKVQRELMRGGATAPSMPLDIPLYAFSQLAGGKALHGAALRAAFDSAAKTMPHSQFLRVGLTWLDFIVQLSRIGEVADVDGAAAQFQRRVGLLLAGVPAEEFLNHLTRLLSLAAVEAASRGSASDESSQRRQPPTQNQRASYA